MQARKSLNNFLKVALPLLLAAVILWWMYRDFQWDEIRAALQGEMNWTWMWLSFPFGISAQVFRAMRWKQVLDATGQKTRLHTCCNAIFLSYASSLAIPRVGEVLRCGVMSRYEGVNFGKSVGTVVSERVIDMLMVALLSLVTVLSQIPVFMTFFHSTGLSMESFLGRFSATGYIVTLVCGLLAVGVMLFLMSRLHIFSRTKAVLTDFRDGLLSIRKVRSPLLFILYSLGIWASYYLHFYLTFYCFGFTEDLGAVAALVAFVVGCFAVLVPTPNGAGPWHFAVKTVLVLYGVDQMDGALFVLIVHTIQTLLVVALGLYALLALSLMKRVNGKV